MPTRLEQLVGVEIYSTPFVLFAGGLPHLVVTDLAWVVAQQRRGLKGRRFPGDVEAENRMAAWFSLTVPEKRFYRNETLLWCGASGDPPYGDTDPAGLVENVRVSLKRLARLLDVIDTEFVHLWDVSKEVGVSSLALCSEDGATRGILAAYEGDHTYKIFSVQPQADLIDLAMNVGAS